MQKDTGRSSSARGSRSVGVLWDRGRSVVMQRCIYADLGIYSSLSCDPRDLQREDSGIFQTRDGGAEKTKERAWTAWARFTGTRTLHVCTPGGYFISRARALSVPCLGLVCPSFWSQSWIGSLYHQPLRARRISITELTRLDSTAASKA